MEAKTLQRHLEGRVLADGLAEVGGVSFSALSDHFYDVGEGDWFARSRTHLLAQEVDSLFHPSLQWQVPGLPCLHPAAGEPVRQRRSYPRPLGRDQVGLTRLSNTHRAPTQRLQDVVAILTHLHMGNYVVSATRTGPLILNCEDSSRQRVDIEADAVVVCAGVESRALSAWFGDRVNVYPVKGYSITVHLDDEVSQAGAPWTSLLDDSAKIVTSRLGRDRFWVAGTAEVNGANRDIRHDRVQPLVDWTRRLFPEINTRRVVSWAGLRPMMPNMMPHVGSGLRPGVFYNTGHGHLGWTLSAATAEMVSDSIDAQLLLPQHM